MTNLRTKNVPPCVYMHRSAFPYRETCVRVILKCALLISAQEGAVIYLTGSAVTITASHSPLDKSHQLKGLKIWRFISPFLWEAAILGMYACPTNPICFLK